MIGNHQINRKRKKNEVVFAQGSRSLKNVSHHLYYSRNHINSSNIFKGTYLEEISASPLLPTPQIALRNPLESTEQTERTSDINDTKYLARGIARYNAH